VLDKCCCLSQTASSQGQYSKTEGRGIAAIFRVTVTADWPVAGTSNCPEDTERISTVRRAEAIKAPPLRDTLFAFCSPSCHNSILSDHRSVTSRTPLISGYSVSQQVMLSLYPRHACLFISIFYSVAYPISCSLNPGQSHHVVTQNVSESSGANLESLMARS
jgi:hypothetical protein